MPQVGLSRLIDRWRRHPEQRREHTTNPRKAVHKLGITLRVLRSKLFYLANRATNIVVDTQRSSIGRERKQARIRRDHLQPVTREIQISDDFRRHRTGRMVQRRAAKPGMNLFSNRTTTNDVTRFEHERLQPTLGEITRSHKSVMPCTNNDAIVVHPCNLWLKILKHLQRRISSRRAHERRVPRAPPHREKFSLPTAQPHVRDRAALAPADRESNS